LTIFDLEALAEGKKPPKSPIITANARDAIIDDGEIEKLNVNSANESKFIVETEKN